MADAAKKLAESLLRELEEIKAYAPTLHDKIWQLMVAESKSNAVSAGKQLPATVVGDEKVQAQVASIIFGKWAIPSSNSFNAWTVVSVLLTQAAANQ